MSRCCVLDGCAESVGEIWPVAADRDGVSDGSAAGADEEEDEGLGAEEIDADD